MNIPYIYESNKNQELISATSAILVLPDIYGQTDYAKNTTNQLAEVFNRPVFLLDYFYQLTNSPNNILQEQQDVAVSLMNKLTGDDFLEFFNKAAADILQTHPTITNFIVVGFCFAGRLAYLSCAEPKVTRIVSFYGAGANLPGFVNGQSAVDFLTRQNRPELKILSFYGTQDESIPAADRAQTKQAMLAAGVNYTDKKYDTDHAYFQPGRTNYDKASANASWQDLKRLLG